MGVRTLGEGDPRTELTNRRVSGGHGLSTDGKRRADTSPAPRLADELDFENSRRPVETAWLFLLWIHNACCIGATQNQTLALSSATFQSSWALQSRGAPGFQSGCSTVILGS